MSKYQEALDFITDHTHPMCETMKDLEALDFSYNILQELVDKATPMKPTITNGKPYCSVCGYSSMIDEFEVSYCFACGQKIDWSNEE